MLRYGRQIHHQTWRTGRLCVFIRSDTKVPKVRLEVTGKSFQNKIVTVYEFTEGQIKSLLFQARFMTVYGVYVNVEHVVHDCLAFLFIFFCSSGKTKPVPAINW